MNGSFNPKVSILIPVFNGGNYLSLAIESALSQTYSNLEIIVINDGSNDGGVTHAICIGYGEKIRYICKENGGCGSALNAGILAMSGVYFSWLSHDDIYLPQKISHQIEVLSRLDDLNTIIYGGYEVIDAQGKPRYKVQPDLVLPEAKLDQKLFPLLRGLIHGCSLLIPSKYFAEIGLFDVSLPTTQDYALWFKFMKVAPIKFSSLILIQSRVHPDQGTHKINTHLEECNELWSGFLSSLTDNEMSEIDTSPYIFRKNMAAFLLNTPYKKAAQLALTMTEETLNQIKISVVIPFHNRINWLIEALESVQKQTHQNYEVIIIDDGSTDELDFLFIFIKHDPRITYYRQKNQGPATARNAGIDYSKGRYIAFLDSDDLFNPSKLSEQLQYMEMLGFMWSHTSYSRIDLEGNIIGAVSSGIRNGIVYPGIIASCPIAMPTVMGLTTIFKQNLFPESLEIGEDVCLWITLARKYPLGGIDKVLSKVRIGPLTAAFNTQKQGTGLLNIALYVMKDENHSLHTRHLRSLLLDTANLFSEINSSAACQISHSVPRPLVLDNQRIKRVFQLFSKGLSSLRVNGIRFTLQRVRSTLKGYLQ